MRRRIPLIIALSVLSAIALGWLGFIGLRNRWDALNDWDRRVDRGFQRVTVGMPRARVEKLMRSQGTKAEQFHLGQPGGFERQYAEAERSKSAYWLSWHNGFDYVYTVGFDDRDRVTYKASGGT
jgi:hypothetical protein